MFSDEDDDDDEDDTEALLAELEQIKKERAEEKLRKVSFFFIYFWGCLMQLFFSPKCLAFREAIK